MNFCKPHYLLAAFLPALLLTAADWSRRCFRRDVISRPGDLIGPHGDESNAYEEAGLDVGVSTNGGILFSRNPRMWAATDLSVGFSCQRMPSRDSQ